MAEKTPLWGAQGATPFNSSRDCCQWEQIVTVCLLGRDRSENDQIVNQV